MKEKKKNPDDKIMALLLGELWHGCKPELCPPTLKAKACCFKVKAPLLGAGGKWKGVHGTS